jgi:hypothetical protein
MNVVQHAVKQIFVWTIKWNIRMAKAGHKKVIHAHIAVVLMAK